MYRVTPQSYAEGVRRWRLANPERHRAGYEDTLEEDFRGTLGEEFRTDWTCDEQLALLRLCYASHLSRRTAYVTVLTSQNARVLPFYNFYGWDLKGFSPFQCGMGSGGVLTYANLCGIKTASLQRIDYLAAEYAVFDRATLHGTIFFHGDFTGGSFRDAVMQDVRFDSCVLTDVDFTGATWNGSYDVPDGWVRGPKNRLRRRGSR